MNRTAATLTALGALACALGAAPETTAPAPASTASVPATIADFAWLAGDWRAQKWGGDLEEHWLEPAGGTMLGVARLVRGDATPFFEFLRLEPVNGEMTLTVHVRGGKGTPFKLTRSGKNEAVFTNPDNDPSEIAYRLDPDGGLYAHIKGVKNGQEYTEPFGFTRAQ